MHYQHVLSLEGFFLPRAFLPTANKALLVGVYVIVVDMFHEIVLCGKLETAVSPMTIRLDEVTRFVSEIFARTETLRMGRWGGCRGRVGGSCRWFPFDFGGGPP